MVSPNFRIDVADYGFADCVVKAGDLDGSGEAPGVQLEFQHSFMDQLAALAMSPREAVLLGRALIQAAQFVEPFFKKKPSQSKWTRWFSNPDEDGPKRSLQPGPRRTENLELHQEELAPLITAIDKSNDPRLARIRNLLELPY